MELSIELALHTQQLMYSRHQRARIQVRNPHMSMDQVQYGCNPYLNTYNSSWQHYLDHSWETSQRTPQPPQEHKSSLEETMAELKRAQAESIISQAQFIKEVNQPIQEELIFDNGVDELAFTMAKLANCGVDLSINEEMTLMASSYTQSKFEIHQPL